jgi:hypothetical protein
MFSVDAYGLDLASEYEVELDPRYAELYTMHRFSKTLQSQCSFDALFRFDSNFLYKIIYFFNFTHYILQTRALGTEIASLRRTTWNARTQQMGGRLLD